MPKPPKKIESNPGFVDNTQPGPAAVNLAPLAPDPRVGAARGGDSLVLPASFPPQKIPAETQTIYMEMLEFLLTNEYRRSFGNLLGAFIQRKRNNNAYWFFRTSASQTGQQEFYIGPDNQNTRDLIEIQNKAKLACQDSNKRVVRLAAMLRSGGITLTDHQAARIIRGLAAVGVFRLGGVLIGTQAYLALGNALGVRWTTGLRTQDIDFGTERRLGIGVKPDRQLVADVPAALDALQLGFLPHVRLHTAAKPTSFVVRNEDWRVDLVTSSLGRDRQTPVKIPRLNMYAQPLEFMNYLLDKTMDAIVINGGATLVRVPEPARFALHKLLVAGNRPPQQAPKAAKDRDQAFQVLSFLEAERPGDIEVAAEDLNARGKGWTKRVLAEADRMAGRIQVLHEVLGS